MIPRLNQLCNIYETTFEAGGDIDLILLYQNVPCRINTDLGQTRTPGGDYVTINAFMHTSFETDIQRDWIIEFEDKYYSVFNIKKIRDLAGDDLFQFLQLQINKNVNA